MSDNMKEELGKLIAAEIQLDNLLNDKRAIQVMLLHQYNDIKDATQIVINHIANIEGTTVTEIHEKLQLYD